MERERSFALAVANAADARGIAEVHVRAWQAAYVHLMPAHYLAGLSVDAREQAWTELLGDAGPETLVARSGSRVIGFAAHGASRDAGADVNVAELWALYVAPEAWDQGVGSALWRAARSSMAAKPFVSASLWVLVGNARAIEFYRRMGFEEDDGAIQPIERGGVRLEEQRMRVSLL